MIGGHKVVVTMPAYNAEATLQSAYEQVMSHSCVDLAIIVDDASRDGTAEIARKLTRARTVVHDRNLGYGANQKTCYRLALEEGADIVVMVHADLQYTPRLIPTIVQLLHEGHCDCVLGSRVRGFATLRDGMPWWRYLGNRSLTMTQNLALGQRLSEYHTGYRAYSRTVLERLPLAENSNDFVFDNQMLLQVIWFGFRIGEVFCPSHYDASVSSISFRRSITYGLGCLRTLGEFMLARSRLRPSRRFPLTPAANSHDARSA